MSHDDSQDSKSPFTISRRRVLGALGGASALTLLGVNPLRAGQDDPAPETSGGDEEVSLDTRLVRDYGIRYPIASAGMAFVGLPELAVAVSNAGGLGVYGAAPEPPPVVDARLGAIASQTSAPFGVDFIIASGPLGDFTTQDHVDVGPRRRRPTARRAEARSPPVRSFSPRCRLFSADFDSPECRTPPAVRPPARLD